MVARTALALLTLLLVMGGAPAALQVENAAGERVTLTLADGERALVVHFWATWCPECKEELPGLERAARDCGGAVRVVAVNVGEPVEVARRFLERQGTTLPLLRDPEGRVWRELARGLPANLIWTRLERRVEVGPHVFEDWGRLLRELGCRSMEER
jgi:thiol-disulfide isomerase/thioredoxin